MAVSSKVGSFNTGTALNTATDITCGFQPKVIWFWTNGRTESTDTAGRADADWSFGFGTQAIERACEAFADDDGAASQAGRESYREDCVIESQSPSASTGLLDLDVFANWPVDGFRVIIDSAFTNSLRVAYLAVGGSDITDYDIVRVSTVGTAIDFDTTSLSFQPDFLCTLSHNPTSDPPVSSTSNARAAIGFATATDQVALAFGVDPGSASADTGAYLLDGELHCTTNVAVPTTIQVRTTFVQFLSNGFRLHVTDVQNGSRISCLAIKGGQWAVGNFAQNASTGTPQSVTTGSTPKGVFIVSANRAESTPDAGTAPLSISLGAATGATERVALAHYSEDGSGNMRVQTLIEHDAVVIEPGALGADGTAANIAGLQDISSFDANGFSVIADDSPSSTWYCGYFAVGEIPSVSVYIPARFVRKRRTQSQKQRLM